MRSPQAVTRNSRSAKVGKSDYARTSAGTRGNDEDAPKAVIGLLRGEVHRPAPLQPPSLPPAFDEDAARQLATDLTAVAPSRVAGTAGDAAAANWFVSQLEQPFGFTVRRERFSFAHDFFEAVDERFDRFSQGCQLPL